MTPQGTALRNLRVADECIWAAIFEKSRTKELRKFHGPKGIVAGWRRSRLPG